MKTHMTVSDLRLPRSVRTMCGRTIDRPMVADSGSARYELTALNGNVFLCTTAECHVSCAKCQNMLASAAVYRRMDAILKNKRA